MLELLVVHTISTPKLNKPPIIRSPANPKKAPKTSRKTSFTDKVKIPHLPVNQW
jgi:hypothetical protein